MTAEVCKPQRKLKFVKRDWAWSGLYQELYDKTKDLMRHDACMKFYDIFNPLYLKTGASSIGLDVVLLQGRDSMNCGQDQVPNNTALCPIAFVSNS